MDLFSYMLGKKSAGSDSGGGSGGGSGGEIDAFLDNSITEITSNAEEVAEYGCYKRTNLVTVNLPKCRRINQNGFNGDSAIENFFVPALEVIHQNGLAYCTVLKVFDAPSLIGLYAQALANCYNLKALILRNATVCGMYHTNVLANCSRILGTVHSIWNPDGVQDGYIYVPSALLEDYRTATNWSAYADRIVAIEGSEYE